MSPTRRTRRALIALAASAVVLSLLAVGGYALMNSRTAQVAGRLVDRVETAEKVVALTFDDGPTAADTDAILWLLAQRGVPATFYVNGGVAAANPGQLERLVAAGHELGNHTQDHKRLIFVTPDGVAAQVEPTDAAIRAAGYDGPITFRPPNAKKLVVAPVWLAQHDRTTVMWDVEAEDFGGGPPQPASDIAERVLAQVRPGSIVLLHPWNGRAATQEATGEVIDELRRRGYRFVTVSELIG
ncbi:polysaccharide deacetylase family protein [Propioniciclava coleopterorum]|nr:polysaccharide deacetylase family protein [Propioniciclava coleopterorum]